jgi:hypothetical protein
MKTIEQVKDFIKKEIPIREEAKSQLFKGNSAWNHHDSVIYAYQEILDYIEADDEND